MGALVVNRVYDRVTVQGEGPFAGRRCTFVRLWGCNLHCAWCDTPETWDTTGRIGPAYERAANARPMTVAEVAGRVYDLDVDLCVVTGGEPLVQADRVGDLAVALARAGIDTHVETNGTIAPGPSVEPVEHFVVSPKLASADAGARALNPQALGAFAGLAWRGLASFKFVICAPADLIEARRLCDRYDVPRSARWAMPEGTDAGTVGAGLAEWAEWAIAAGFNVSTRLHVLLWGAEKGR